MSHRNDYDDDGDDFSGSENDNALDEDLEALRRACMIVGADPNDLGNSGRHSPVAPSSPGGDAGAWSSDGEDDLALVRNIQNRLALSDDVCQPLSLEALCTLPPVTSDDEEDDFETLRVIQQRFSAYNSNDTMKSGGEDFSQTQQQVHASSVASENTTSNNSCSNIMNVNAGEGFKISKETCKNLDILRDNVNTEPCASAELPPQSDVSRHSIVPQKPSFPKSAQMFIDAIKKNRAYQKFIRSKLTQIESRIEENKKLRERVKILKDFQVSCRKITGRALSQKKDPRVQLISAQKLRNSKDSEVTDKKPSAMNYGPAENSHVANYRTALEKFPLSLQRKKWSKTESENLGKGIRQQFQEMMLQLSVDRLSVSEGPSANTNGLDNIFASIKDLEVTPEMIREFLPKVNWNQLASMYVEGRSGAECEARWLNYEDPLINHNPWTAEEDKKLLLIIQEKGINDWFDIAVSLGTNRTPFQCLARYQRSLNACMLKREWTEEEDDQLRIAVEALGDSNWQFVASTLKGRTGTQCSNRWNKTLHPMRQKVGRWTPDEDKRLTVATMLFGPRNWKKIAQFVPGRTQVQCRERWVNSLDPSVNRSKWTAQEDLRLEAAIEEHGYCWSKVAAALPSRTDNQCWRRWKALHPHEVPLLQAARKMQKAALICNFVDREQERPALGPSDFIPLVMINSAPQLENVNSSKKCKRKSRKPKSGKEKDASNVRKKVKSEGAAEGPQVCSEEVSGMTNSDEIETSDKDDAILKKKTVKPHSGKKRVNSRPDSAKKSLKRGSEKQYCAELDESNQGNLLQTPENCTSDGEGENFSLTGINKAKKQYCGMKRCNETSEECHGVACTSCQQNSCNMSKSRTKSCSKDLLQASDGDDITLACFLRNKSKKRKLGTKTAEQVCSPSRKKNMGSPSLSQAVDQHENEIQMPSQMQNGEAHTNCNVVTPEYMSLCGMQSSHLKDMQTTGASDKKCAAENMVEGGFITYREPVLEPTTNVNVVDDLEAGDTSLACLQNRLLPNMPSSHSKDMQKVVTSDKEHGRGDLVNSGTITLQAPVREQISNKTEGDVDVADITLACWRKKLKKCNKLEGDVDAADITLACLSNKLKKR
ncbi:Myb-like protein [Melia azedarach]|uniref:Myb-like protein n=1 Tax=Melia azedarach TaxID=155640 RepID=A0ACC1XRE7_MELAZ|nr:Myb-like protein [Melia azedarach]